MISPLSEDEKFLDDIDEYEPGQDSVDEDDILDADEDYDDDDDEDDGFEEDEYEEYYEDDI